VCKYAPKDKEVLEAAKSATECDGEEAALNSRIALEDLKIATCQSSLFDLDEACQAHIDDELANIRGYNTAKAELSAEHEAQNTEWAGYSDDSQAQKAFVCKYGPKVLGVYEAAKNNPKCAGEGNADNLELYVKVYKVSISIAKCDEGANVGLIVGVLVGVLLVVGLSVLYVKKYKE
jgi:hypothetical protein